MTKILVDSELLERALFSMQEFGYNTKEARDRADTAIIELRAALDAPQQEPCGYWFRRRSPFGVVVFDIDHAVPPDAIEYGPLYLHPAPRVPEGWQERKPLAGAMTLAHRMCTKYLHDGRLRYSFTEQHMQDFIARLLGAKAPSADDRKDAEICTCRFEKAPCYICGYNGPGYYQPAQHKCAEKYHAAIAAQKGEKE